MGSMQRSFGQVIVEVLEGNIVTQPDMDAIVNAANAQLLPGGGVAGAIHKAAGAGLKEECRPLAPIGPGEAVITSGHNLPNRFVIHCLGPIYGRDHPADVLLANCYRSALSLAEEKGLTSVVFPSISTGVFGYPLRAAAEVALGTVVEETVRLSSLSLVRFVLFGHEAFAVHKQVLQRVPTP
jgi:O-acetyl-ADP-ribose deacetylase (regulator of RNase III)